MTEVVEAVVAPQGWRPLAVIAGISGVLVAAALTLWVYYGTAVFYEMVAAGIAMCL